MEKIKENSTRSEEEMDLTIGECNTFLREVENQVYDVLSWKSNFKFKVHILDCRTILCKKFEAYIRKKSRVKLAILKLNNIPEEMLQKSLSVKLVDTVFLKKALKGKFEEVINATE